MLQGKASSSFFLSGTSSLFRQLGRHWRHSCDKMNQAFPIFCYNSFLCGSLQTRPHISDHINTLTSSKHMYSAPTDKTLGLVVVHWALIKLGVCGTLWGEREWAMHWWHWTVMQLKLYQWSIMSLHTGHAWHVAKWHCNSIAYKVVSSVKFFIVVEKSLS